MRKSALVLALLFGACESDPDGLVFVDAPSSDAAADAPYHCVAARRPASACLALEPSSLQGTTPFGDLAVQLDYFGAGDCITISSASIGWSGSCGEQLALQFSYPVVSGADGKRAVTTSFDREARFEFRTVGGAPQQRVANIHVDVVRWQEGDGVHDIDITVTVMDTAFAIAPVHVRGTFCDWPYYLC